MWIWDSEPKYSYSMCFKKSLPISPTRLAEIFAEIPGDLFSEDRTVIGRPGAGDWAGYYLETNLDGETRYWLIDKMSQNLPSYLREFEEQLDEAIQLVDGSMKSTSSM